MFKYGKNIFPSKNPISTIGCAKWFAPHIFVWSCYWYCLWWTDKGRQNGQLSTGL